VIGAAVRRARECSGALTRLGDDFLQSGTRAGAKRNALQPVFHDPGKSFHIVRYKNAAMRQNFSMQEIHFRIAKS
jgi:hypothetical protein